MPALRREVEMGFDIDTVLSLCTQLSTVKAEAVTKATVQQCWHSRR